VVFVLSFSEFCCLVNIASGFQRENFPGNNFSKNISVWSKVAFLECPQIVKTELCEIYSYMWKYQVGPNQKCMNSHHSFIAAGIYSVQYFKPHAFYERDLQQHSTPAIHV
jgi:hypothetical protein